MTVDPMCECARLGRLGRWSGLLLVWWSHRQERKGGTARSPIVCQCNE
jgi:hypothetical protein